MTEPTKPLDGMTIRVKVKTPNGEYWQACTPVDIKPEVLEFYLKKFAKQIWKNIEYAEFKK